MGKRTALIFAVIASLALVTAGPLAAKPKLPHITGGGITLNLNSGGPPMWTIGGFSAHATDDTSAPVYEAKGQAQGKNVLAGDPSTKISQAHGRVVCIANLGPANSNTGGVSGNDVWEIRFEITKFWSHPEIPFAAPQYGSIYVQDNGKDDYADENFDAAEGDNPECDVVKAFQLEPQLQGNIKVHE